MNEKYIKRQIKYFTTQHKNTETFSKKLIYNKCIYFWENKLSEVLK